MVDFSNKPIGYSPGYAGHTISPGLSVQPTLDMTRRTMIELPPWNPSAGATGSTHNDGMYGSEYSMTRHDNGMHVLMPTIYDGAMHSPEHAFQHYQQTGEHMGKFADANDPGYVNSNAYATPIHQRPITVNGETLHGPTIWAGPDNGIDYSHFAGGNARDAGFNAPSQGWLQVGHPGGFLPGEE